MKFKMNNSEYEIIEVSQKELMEFKEQDEGYYYGQTHFIEHQVWIDQDLPLERKKEKNVVSRVNTRLYKRIFNDKRY